MAPLGLTPILSFEEERVLCTMFDGLVGLDFLNKGLKPEDLGG
jgi:hypothetical protein